VGYTNNAACDAAIDAAEANLREIVRRAKAFPGVHWVFVSTLTPGRPGPKTIDAERIRDMNDHIITVVAGEGALLVDSYTPFVGHEGTYVSTDGLHLLPPGYQAMAEAFYNKIVATVPKITPQFFK
jgi:lysophospholipase L1-like esterase